VTSKSQAFLVACEEIIITGYYESDKFLSSFFGYRIELPTHQFAWRQIECTSKWCRATNDSVLKVLRKAVHRIIGCTGVLHRLSEGARIFF